MICDFLVWRLDGSFKIASISARFEAVNAVESISPNKLQIVDCVSGKRATVEDGTFAVGSDPASDLRIEGGEADRMLMRITRVLGAYHIYPGGGEKTFIFDGQEVSNIGIRDKSEHTVVVKGCPFIVRMSSDVEEREEWLSSIDPESWHVYKRSEQEWAGPVSRAELPLLINCEPGEVIIMCGGMKEMGFYPHQIMTRLTGPATNGVAHSSFAPAGEVQFEVPEVNVEYGEFTCPVCWFRFDRGDVMNIAIHASLRGDPILGEEHMQRFLASRFNDRGQALDAMGLSAPEIACPHCRRKLPPNFLDQPHHIFSIVGAPSSGKSYYLSVLVKKMQDIAFKHFGVTFRDAAPSENAVLNDMRNHLFSAGTPEEAYFAKTDLEGALYETLPRQGRQVRLPKPFVFRMTDKERGEDGFSIVFYDNAGEHFEPGRNSADSPGAQHIAVASGIFFLFDPLYNPEFRRKLEGHSDPQLAQRRSDQQDILLAESETRIKEILGLSSSERISTPLAVIAGKSDAWLEMLGDAPLLPALDCGPDGARIRVDHIRENSDRVRNLLLGISPSIVANAEAISSDVMFFAASPLGHPPVRFEDSEGHIRIGPDPVRLNPQRVEDATLWVLSKIAPSMFPSYS
jgi:hypothetical protein